MFDFDRNLQFYLPGGKLEDFGPRKIALDLTNRPSIVEGPFGKDVMDFNGGSHELVSSSSQSWIPQLEEIFVGFWLKPNLDSILYGLAFRNTDSDRILFGVTSGGKLFLHADINDESNNELSADGTFTLGQSFFAGYSIDTNLNLNLYINSKTVYQGSIASGFSQFLSDPYIYVGSRGGATFFNGSLGNIKIFNAIPSEEQLQRIINQDKSFTRPIRRPKPFVSLGTIPDLTDESLVFSGLNALTKGSAKDASNERNDGTATDVKWLDNGGGYFSDNGSINLGDKQSLDPGSGSWTFAITLRTNITITSGGRLYDSYVGGGSANGIQFFILDSGTFVINIGDGTSSGQVISVTKSEFESIIGVGLINTGFHRIVLVIDKANLNVKLYVDGLLVDLEILTITGTIYLAGTNSFLGAQGVANTTFSGELFDTEIYNEDKSSNWVANDWRKRNSDDTLLLEN